MESSFANSSQGDSFKRMSLLYFGFMTAKTCEKSVLHITYAHMHIRCSLNISAHRSWESWELGRGLSDSQIELMSPQPICGDSVINLLI